MVLRLLTRIAHTVLAWTRNWRQAPSSIDGGPASLDATNTLRDQQAHGDSSVSSTIVQPTNHPRDDDPPTPYGGQVTDAGKQAGGPRQSQPSTTPETRPTHHEERKAKSGREADAITPDHSAPRTVVRQDPPTNAAPVLEQGDGKSDASNGPVVGETDKGPVKRPKRPQDRGGVRGPRPRQLLDQPRPPDQTPPPKLVCRANGTQWEVVLSTPDECQLKAVDHNGQGLEPEAGECILPSLGGHLSIVYGGGRLDLPLCNDNPMVFKLGADWSGWGRYLNGINDGYFIVIAPKEWTRIGPPPVAPEGCTDGRYLAHYFHRSKRDTEDVAGFEEDALGLNTVSADLEGRTLFDDAKAGRLFGLCPPRLKRSKGIAWARIGEEGGGVWSGENFRPPKQTLAEILRERQGHFYVRVYDQHTKLQDSCEFRYLRDLKEIRVNDEPYTHDTVLLPGAEGHAATVVSFVANAPLDLKVRSTHANANGSRVIVDPHPAADDVRCTLASDDGRVDIQLHLPRIWWRVEHGAGSSTEWCDKPLNITRRQFAEWGKGGGKMRVRLPRRFRSVGVGFNDALEKRYYTVRADGINHVQLLVPLDGFVAYPQIAERLNEDVALNVDCGGAVVTLIQVAHDPLPRINRFTCDSSTVEKGQRATLRWKTANTEASNVAIEPGVGAVLPSGSKDVAPTTDTTYTLRLTTPGLAPVTKMLQVMTIPRRHRTGQLMASVMGHGKLRRGKGFALGELCAASLTIEDAKQLLVRIDKRRRTTHPINVAMIRRLFDV